MENGSIVLIGATTENPSFEINSALLSRCKVFVLKALEERDLCTLLQLSLIHIFQHRRKDVLFDKRKLIVLQPLLGLAAAGTSG